MGLAWPKGHVVQGVGLFLFARLNHLGGLGGSCALCLGWSWSWCSGGAWGRVVPGVGVGVGGVEGCEWVLLEEGVWAVGLGECVVGGLVACASGCWGGRKIW